MDIKTGTPEEVALVLTVTLAKIEKRSLSANDHSNPLVDRAWLLSTYAECLQTVKFHSYEPPKPQR